MPTVCPTCGTENPDRAKFCSNCAAPLLREEVHEERKLATVLFADLVGSTSMADEQDPERTRQMLNRFYDTMTDEVERHGGTVEKFAGDAVMAAFGGTCGQPCSMAWWNSTTETASRQRRRNG